MYQNFYYNRQDGMCHIWDDHDGLSSFPYQEYAYQIDPKGEYTTLTGLKVKKVRAWSKEAEKQGMIFEHDVPIPTKVLIDHYFESDEPSKNHRILFFDIEVEKGLKYSTAAEALNTITSVAYYFQGRYVCLLLDQEGNLQNCTKTITINNQEINVAVLVFGQERELLLTFLKYWEKINPTIVSGWNSDIFDCPYLYNRICNVLGKQYGSRLSPIKIVYQRPLNKRDVMVTIAGVSQMDYMQLYKKFTYNEESSYSLDAISKKELKRGKYVYEGTLDQLFKENIDGFIEYNVNDVELLVALDKKMDLIEIARGICHKGHVPYEDYQFSSRYLDGAIQTRCKRKNIVTVGKIGTDAGKADGAFVKPPNVGKHNWVYSIDAQSLYPSLIITQNISLETQIASVKDWDKYQISNKLVDQTSFKSLSNFGYLDDDVELDVTPIIHELFSERSDKPMKLNKQQFIDYLTEYNATISSAGVIFTTKQKGIVPDILEEWFSERLHYKSKMKEFNQDSDEYIYFDRKQLITKILLNSLYGVLLLPTFRYYSRLSGESVTLSGQTLIKFADWAANLFYKHKLGDRYKTNCVIYQDSDSAYLDAKPLIADIETMSDYEIAIKTQEISNEVTEFINKATIWFAKNCFNSNNNRLIFNQEKISKRAFWGQAKKRYAQLSVEPLSDGTLKEKVDVKGFDLVRSSFPKIFRNVQKDLVLDILHDIPVSELNQKVRAFKKEYKNSPIFDIMLPSSVKEISKYKDAIKGTPIHVKSAQNYNKLLSLHKIESIPPIDDGDKIVYAYMQQNPFGFETMALKGQGEDPEPLVEFVERFIDRERVFQSTFISKLDTIWHDLGWGKVEQQEPNNFF